MPNQQDMARANARRAARKAQREQNVERAHEQERVNSTTVKEQRVKQAANPKQAASARKVSVREQTAARRAQAEAKADAQDKTLKAPPVDTRPYFAAGVVPPLHVLNAISREGAGPINEHARNIANAAGKAAYGVAVGQKPQRSGQSDKMSRVVKAQTARQTAQKQKDNDANGGNGS